MSTRFFTEPDSLPSPEDAGAAPAGQSGPAPSQQDPHTIDQRLDSQWDEEKWSSTIVEQLCVNQSKNKLEKRMADIVAEASPQEQDDFENSRKEFLKINERAKSLSSIPGDDRSFLSKVKDMWRQTNEVAYDYVQMLDVMVGQAPEYVGLAYGAVKIILVVQINHQEVKTKARECLNQIQLKFQIIDHLTWYIPSSRLVTLVSEAYSLFYRFLSKAVAYYTQSRLKSWAKAITKPWKRFQEIVDSIDQTLENIKDVAQYCSILQGHASSIMIRQNLVLSQRHDDKLDKVLQLFEELSCKIDVESVHFTRKEDIRQAESALYQSTAKRLNEPAIDGREQDSKSGASVSTNTTDDIGLDDDILFPELHKVKIHANRNQQAKEELPEMRTYRSERKCLTKSEMALAWAESRRSEILWVDGYQLLTRANFNASFVFPLLQLVESTFESVVALRHFCQARHKESNSYLIMMQDLVSQMFRQNPSIAKRQRASMTRDITSSTHALWSLFSIILRQVQAQCVFLIIGGIENLVKDSPNAQETRTDLVNHLHGLTETRLMKIILTLEIPQPEGSTMENISSLAVYRHQTGQKRALSFDSMQSSLPVLSLQLTELQEKRSRRVTFTQLPMVYTPGSIVYSHEAKHLRAFAIHELRGMSQKVSGVYDSLRIRAWSVDHNGTYICKRYHEFKVPFFLGQREIATMPYVPSGYLPDELTRREELVARGRLFWSMGSGSHHREITQRDRLWRTGQRIIVDQSSRPIQPEAIERFSDQFRQDEASNVKPRFLMLAPPEIAAFNLKDLAWMMCDVTSCGEVDFTDSIDGIVMPESTKSLIIAGFRRHERSGSALTLLLHGAPGTGKRFTTKSVADAIRRPIISLTTGDIGSDNATLEQRMSDWFQMAERWNAVIVLTESHVLLARRDPADVERNVRMSILVKVMDKFRGILFLLTDRLGSLDDALLSRIHLSVYYPPLSDETRAQIFNRILDRLEAENTVKLSPSAREFLLNNKEIREMGWSGKDMENGKRHLGRIIPDRSGSLSSLRALTVANLVIIAISMARALAEQRERRDLLDQKHQSIVELDTEDFEVVVASKKSFTDYLKTLPGGMSDWDLRERERLREERPVYDDNNFRYIGPPQKDSP